MITIPKKVEYSIILIAFLAKNRQSSVSLTSVAAKLRLPYRFLGQLAGKLKGAGIVTSREGKSGGYELVEGWQKKNLYDLMAALGENKRMVKCLGDEECSRVANCELKKIWNRVEDSFVREMKLIRLEEI
ncbi:MAG: Rrf2 family transcriptional regulator [Microgenomates group bacterium]